MVKFTCSRCGEKEFFLRKKGNAVGQYCYSCEGWHKWVGKKDLPKLKRMGIGVMNEDYIPERNRQFSVQEEVLQENEIDFSAMKRSMGVVDEEKEYLDSLNEEYACDYFDEKDEVDVKPHIKQGVMKDDGTPCLTCISGKLESINTNDDIQSHIFENVLTVMSKDFSKRYGSFKVIFCPTCGRRLE